MNGSDFRFDDRLDRDLGTRLDEPLFPVTPGGERPAEEPDAPRWKREHFIPLRKADLVRLLAEDAHLANEPREQFLELCRRLEATLHFEYHCRLERLKDLYAPFNPDSVMHEAHPISAVEREAMVPRLFEELRDLLQRANYHRLSDSELEQAVGTASEWGVRLNLEFEVFRQLAVFARGDVHGRRALRRWQNWYRLEEVDVPIYQRLMVAFQLRPHRRLDDSVDTEQVYLKVFKNIPKQDLDMLLPGTTFRMSLLDHGKIILPTLSGVAIAVAKIFTGAVIFAFTTIFKLLTFLAFIAGMLGYGVKSILGYLQTKNKYQLSLTRNLYYQNLDNNAGVLFRVLDEAEEQEVREAILAYALLRGRGPEQGWSDQELDHHTEEYLNGLLDVKIDFEVHDALAKLERLGCVEQTERGNWKAVPMELAIAHLDQRWDRQFHPENVGGPGGRLKTK